MRNFFRILRPVVIVIVIIYIAFSLKHNYDRHSSHKNLERIIIEKDSIIKQDSIQHEETLKWMEGYQERIQILEQELDSCQNKK